MVRSACRRGIYERRISDLPFMSTIVGIDTVPAHWCLRSVGAWCGGVRDVPECARGKVEQNRGCLTHQARGRCAPSLAHAGNSRARLTSGCDVVWICHAERAGAGFLNIA